MSKKSKIKYKFPKRVLGARVPKQFRRFVSTPLGGAILAEAVVFGAAALTSRGGIRSAFDRMGSEASQAGSAGASFLTHAAKTALVPFAAAAHGIMDRADSYRGGYGFDASERANERNDRRGAGQEKTEKYDRRADASESKGASPA